MNSNISKGKWEFLEDSHSFKIDSDNGLIATIIPNQTQVFKGTCRGNFKAICNAINNTYGKGIDPTLLPDIMRENEELKARCETYKKYYESMVAVVVNLSGENSKMREMIGERIKELETD